MTLRMPKSEPDEAAGNLFNWKNVLIAAAWFGCVAGLIEGGVILLTPVLGLQDWYSQRVASSWEILWFAPLFDFALFLLAAVPLLCMGRFLSGKALFNATIGMFASMTLFDWLSLSWRLRTSGVAVLSLGLATLLVRRAGRDERAVISFVRKTIPYLAGCVLGILLISEVGGWARERAMLASLPPARRDAPNILFIVVDTLRSDHLSAYGYSRQTSPMLDELAGSGVLFEHAYSTSSWTLPAHASMLTGRLPHEHGAELEPYDGRYRMLPEALSEYGYRSAAISANSSFFTRRAGFQAGFVRFDDYSHTLRKMAERTLYGVKFFQLVWPRLRSDPPMPGRRDADEITSGALRWIGHKQDRPFFAFVNYFDVHEPYCPPHPWRSKFSKVRNTGGQLLRIVEGDQRKPTPKELQNEVDAYDGAIAYVDAAVARLLGELKARGLMENTLVIVTSDHGEAFGEHGYYMHRQTLYREELHVPLLLSWPGHIPSGQRVTSLVSIASLAATAMEIAISDRSNTFSAPSLAMLWTQPAEQKDSQLSVLAETVRVTNAPQDPPSKKGWMKTLISSKWQYIVHETLGEELYDRVKDPSLTNNLAKTPEGQEQVRAFREQLRIILLEKSQWLPHSQQPVGKAGRE